ncbi:MAG: hypothetical protein WAT15_08690, partial [Gemmiger qucibialis]
CAFGLASAAPRSPYRHLELCGIALIEMIKWAIRQESGVAGRGPYRQKKIATKITSSNGSAALLPADS